MASAKLTLSALAAICLTYAPETQAQGVRATTLGYNTWLSNSGVGISSPPTGMSGRARWSCWIWMGTFAPNEERILFESAWQGTPQPATVMSVGLESTTNVSGIPNGVHIKMSATDGPGPAGQGQVMTAMSADSVPVGQGKWVHLMGGWDTNFWFPSVNRFALAATINNVFVQWASNFTGGSFSPMGFITPYQNPNTGQYNNWSHGAHQNPVTGAVSEYINGDLAECYFNSYLPGGGSGAFSILDEDTGRMIPLPLGPLGMGPTNSVPQMYFHGGAATYPLNNHDPSDPLTMSPFTVNGTPLVDAPDDPFQ